MRNLTEYDLSHIADAMRCAQKAPGTVVMKKGENCTEFFIIETGSAKAVFDGKTVQDYCSGDFFGELALLHDEPSATSVVTTSPTTFLVLEQKAFRRLLGSLP